MHLLYATPASAATSPQQATDEFATVFSAAGENGVREYAITIKNRITSQEIISRALDGVKQRDPAALTIARILAETTGDKRVLADVLMQVAHLGQISSDNILITESLDKALLLYRETANIMGEGNVHRLRGDILAKRGDRPQAMEAYHQALTFYTTAANIAEQGRMRKNIADLLAAAGSSDDAMEQYRAALALYEKCDTPLGSGNVWQGMGELLLKARDAAALPAFEQARYYYEKSGNSLGQGNAWYRIGGIAVQKGNHTEAFEAFTRALGLYELSKSRASVLNVRRNLANLMVTMADTASRSNDHRTALEHYRKGLGFMEADYKPSEKAPLYRVIADTFLKLDDTGQAAEYYTLALAAYEKSGNRASQAAIHKKLGDTHLKAANSIEAVKAYETARAGYEKSGEQGKAANMYRLAGTVLRAGKETARARAYLEKSLALFERNGIVTEIPELCLVLGEIASETGAAPQALAYYEKGVAHLRENGNPVTKSYLYRNLANIHAAGGDNQKALDLFEKAVLFLSAAGEHNELGVVLQHQGDVFLKQGDSRKALDCFLKAGELFRQSSDNQAGQGSALRGAGDAYYFSGNIAKAFESYSAALSFFVKQHDLNGLGTIYHRLGDLAMQEGANKSSLENYARAFSYYEEAGDVNGMGTALRSQADVLTRMGDTAKALEYQAKASVMLEKTGDLLGRAHGIRSQGDIYLRTGNNERARVLYEEALSLYRKAGDLSGEGNIIRIIGNVHFQAGEYDQALKRYETAFPLFEKSGDLPGQGNVYQNMGDIAYLKGQNTAALQLYAKALSLFDKCGDQLGRTNVFKSQADVYTIMHDPKKALPLYQSALDFYVRSGDIESQAYTTLGMAKAATSEDTPDSAMRYYHEGLALLEKVRKQTAFAQMKKGFMEKVYDFYEEATVFMLNNKRTDMALQSAESMKARVFLDQLAEGQINLDQGIDPKLNTGRIELETRITALNKQLAAAGPNNADRPPPASLRQALAEAEKELHALRITLRLNNPLYASVQYPEPVSIKRLQEEILKHDEALLEYFVTSEKVYCFVVTGDETRTFTLAVTRKQLDRYADDLINTIKTGPSRNPRKFEDASITLYEALVRPLEGVVENKTVLIIPDGVLARIPFEVLLQQETDGKHYFIENNPLKYFQSATLLALQRTTFRKEEVRSASFAGFGDPVYDYASYHANRPESQETSVAYGASAQKLARLEASGREIAAIRGIFEARKLATKTFLRADAREEQAKSSAMKDYGYIHFAAHGILETKRQAIALSQIPGSSEDGFLTIGEIMKSKYTNARLVVLSACQSGLGELDRGEGVTGLTRAVMYAGSPAAVVSLWNVSDIATKTLMEAFYDNIITRRLSLEDGLRAAKLEMIRQGSFRHPLFWGAFIMYGE